MLLNLFLLFLFLSFKSLDSNTLELSVTSLACFPQKWVYNPAWPVRRLALQPKWLSQRINRSRITVRPPPTFYSNNQQSVLFSSEIGREKEDGICHYQGLLLMPFGDHVPENRADAATEEEWGPLTVWPTGFSCPQASLPSELSHCVSYWVSSSTETSWSCLMPSDVSWRKVRGSKEIVTPYARLEYRFG